MSALASTRAHAHAHAPPALVGECMGSQHNDDVPHPLCPKPAPPLAFATLAIGAGAGGVVGLWDMRTAALIGATLAIGVVAGGVVWLWLCVGAWGGCSCCIAME